ncbi:hypothetical protein SCP_0305800 [Sparassis crispa]|uniref:Sld7 C-terminal domain-containing protein n=1 Tax=Sparassis crispa TaxID=139825 RepID=A0A401GFB5_9APHY|nr:hypothetical protein SCP_0305800 [Sparassis crispa]GBE80860.1 hypothetical protein SCP_0305800 [Sparassis crispa]
MAAAHRLLYRGALSLPDSHLLLDGLSFTATIADGADLFNNPLALALESMRGRPSLHFLGTTTLKNVYLDFVGNVSVDIHPLSTITRICFENILCSIPITSANRKTDHGIRVSLSDSSDVGTTDILIYGQLKAAEDPSDEPVPSTSTSTPTTLHLLAARILPTPPPAVRPPRPDDPTPRKPPPLFGAKRKREPSGLRFELGDSAKRSKASHAKGKGPSDGALEDDEDALERAREVMLHMPRSGPSRAGPGKSVRTLGRDARVAKRDGEFKVPMLPARLTPLPSEPQSSTAGRSGHTVDGKHRAGGVLETSSPEDVEKANKATVKRAAVRCLADHGIGKDHDEFNELFQMIYRGTSFALRSLMRPQEYVDLSQPLNANVHVYPGDPQYSCCPALTLSKDGVNVQAISMGSHTGTHVDAPYHFIADGTRIDQIGLERFVGPALVVDLTAKRAKEKIVWADLTPYESEMRRRSGEGGSIILLLRTGWSRYWGTETYLEHPFLDERAAQGIVNAGVRVLGVDTLSPDETSHEADFAAHRVVLGAGGIIAENLNHLEAIQEGEWIVNLVPLKLEGCDGSPVRAFAWRHVRS